MASLYEINQSILNCVEVEPGTTVNMETGEVIDLEKLSLLKMERSEKIRNIALWIKNLKADAKALKEEKEAFYKRQKVAENKAAQLESYLANVLDGEKVKETEFSIGWRKSKAVTITDENLLDCTAAESRQNGHRESLERRGRRSGGRTRRAGKHSDQVTSEV